MHAQITNPIPAPIVKRGLASRSRTSCACRIRAGCVRPIRTCRRPAGRASASCAICRTAAASPTTRAASSTCSIANNQPHGVRERRRGVSARHLQPARERIHRVRLSSGVRAERLVLHGARRARAGQSDDAELHPAGFTAKDVTYHNVITEWHATNPAANTFEGTRRELLRVGARRREPDAPDGRRRVQPDGEARRRRLRPALHERQRSSGSATAADRTRTTRARRSASTRSSPRSCASIRAVRR